MECICQSLSLIINFCHSEQGNISAPDPLWFDLPRHLGDRQSSPSFRSHSQHFAGSARGNQCWHPLIPTGWLHTWVCWGTMASEAQAPRGTSSGAPGLGVLLLINYWGRTVFYLGRWQNQGQSVRADQFGGFSPLRATLGAAIISQVHIDYIPMIFSQPSWFGSWRCQPE